MIDSQDLVAAFSFPDQPTSDSPPTTRQQVSVPPTKGGLPGKQQVHVPADKWDLLHTLAYYLYTGRVTFGTDLSFKPSDPKLPNLCNVQAIYETALDLGLEQLKHKCIDFLKKTNTVKNITTRLVLHIAKYPGQMELTAMYSEYFIKYWSQIRVTDEYKEAMNDAEDYNSNEYRAVMRTFRGFMEMVELKVWGLY